MAANKIFTNAIAEVFDKTFEKQPEGFRRKDSIRDMTGAAVNVIGTILIFASSLPEWLALVLIAVVGILQTVHAATTKAPLAPSQKEKLIKEASRAHVPDLPGDAEVMLMNIADAIDNKRAKERGTAGYGKGASNEQLAPLPEPENEGEEEYVGKHRLNVQDVVRQGTETLDRLRKIIADNRR